MVRAVSSAHRAAIVRRRKGVTTCVVESVELQGESKDDAARDDAFMRLGAPSTLARAGTGLDQAAGPARRTRRGR